MHANLRLALRTFFPLLPYLFSYTTAATQTLSHAEQIYAALAQLPPAERQNRIEAGARQEGQIAVVQTMRDEIGSDQIKLFEKRYPFLKVEATTSLGSPDGAERLYSEDAAGRRLTDAINCAIADLSELLNHNMLARYKTPVTNRILPKYRSELDPQGRYTLSFWSDRGMIYNTDLVPPDKTPKQWSDLCDPFFRRKISFDPMQTRLVAGFQAMFGDKTVDFIRCLAANKPIVQRGVSQRFYLMMAGDHMVEGDGYTYQAIAAKRENPAAPVAIVSTAPILAGFGAAAINRYTQHPYASALFIDWMLSDESQSFLAERLRAPVTLKHPFLPENANIVVMPDTPSVTQLDPLVTEWRRDIEGR